MSPRSPVHNCETLDTNESACLQMINIDMLIALAVELTEGINRRAFQYFRAAADWGYLGAQIETAYCLENGLGVDKDIENAVYYYRLAVRQGSVRAGVCLGRAYMDDINVAIYNPQPLAVNNFKMAAEQGCGYAQLMLACLYLLGHTDTFFPDVPLAIDYLKRSSDAGLAPASFLLVRIYQNGDAGEVDIS